MITKEEAEDRILNNLDLDRLIMIVNNTSEVAWNKVISISDINDWLKNFTGRYFSNVECEKRLALWLLLHFTFYTEDDIRNLCKNLFNLIMHNMLIKYDGKKNVNEVLNEILYDSVFVGLGNPSESGQHLLYQFRQANKLPKKCFDFDFNSRYKNIILLDDMTVSGSQALGYIKNLKCIADNIYVGFLISTEDAIKEIEKQFSDIKVFSTILLDSRDKAFSDDSFVFSDASMKCIKEYAMEFCREYGKIAVEKYDDMKDCELGFNNGQYLFGLVYNTPDNTLPIFWGESDRWIPLFTRFHKIYGYGKEAAIDGRKYY